jgi:hypothetical protein
MATEYIFGVTAIKYGTPTGSNTMPGGLTSLPDTVKGSITFEESEGSFTSFFVDQKKAPIKKVKTEEGEMTFTAQFYDMDGQYLTDFKGGATGIAGFELGTDYVTVEKAIEVTFDSGHTLNVYNGGCSARITGGGGRDKMVAWELKVTPQVTANNTGIWGIEYPV